MIEELRTFVPEDRLRPKSSTLFFRYKSVKGYLNLQDISLTVKFSAFEEYNEKMVRDLVELGQRTSTNISHYTPLGGGLIGVIMNCNIPFDHFVEYLQNGPLVYCLLSAGDSRKIAKKELLRRQK